MVISALVLVAVAIAACAIGIRYTLGALGLGAMQTLMYLGLAEVPPPPVSRRRVRSL